MHLVMLYAQAGKPIPDGDPYELDGYRDDVRDFMKIALNTLLNASNDEEAIGAMINGAKNFEIINTRVHMRELLQKFRHKHKPIKHYFHRGVGIYLQNQDSAVTEQVMLTLAESGIAALPNHDNFITRTAHWSTVYKAMALWFEKICSAEVRLKLTSPERFHKVLRGSEVEHQPTRQRGRHIRRFKSAVQAQLFLWVHGNIQNLFVVGRHLLRPANHRILRAHFFLVWSEVTCA